MNEEATFWRMEAEKHEGTGTLAAEHDELRGRIEDLALSFERSALATWPSKKSETEDRCARVLRALLTSGSPDGGDERDRLAAELDDWKARYRDGMAEANQLRALVAEILGHAVFSANEYDLIDEWRKRAGMES